MIIAAITTMIVWIGNCGLVWGALVFGIISGVMIRLWMTIIVAIDSTSVEVGDHIAEVKKLHLCFRFDPSGFALALVFSEVVLWLL